ncbi:MAG: methyltransferase [Bdellovibrionota bacterium]
MTGAKLVLQLSTSFMPATLHNCLNALKGRGAFANHRSASAVHIADSLELNENATSRFLNAATSVGLLTRNSNGIYTLTPKPILYDGTTSKAMFWLVRSGANKILCDVTKSPSQIKAELLKLPEADEMIAIALSHKILSETEGGLALSTQIKDYLDPDSELYMGLWIQNYDRIASRIFSRDPLLAALQSGKTQWQLAFGAEVRGPFDFVNSRPELFRDLMEGMHQANVLEGELFAQKLDLSKVETVLDVGGASGAWSLALAKAAPHIKSIQIYELESAVPLYQEMFLRYSKGLGYPIAYVPGDFFKHTEPASLYGLPVNQKFDMITLGWILHDWNDTEALSILKKVRAHIHDDGKLTLAEAILPEDRLGPTTLLDITMLLQTGGKERTRVEFEKLLADAGFKLELVIDVERRRQLLIASPFRSLP